jgi:arylsulfatase A
MIAGLRLLLLALVSLPLAAAEPAEPRRPNVILIMADDLGYRDLACYGHPSIRTPVLDRLAAEGIRLTNFHSGATVCTPSRMALLTGAYPVRLGWTQGVIGYKIGLNEGMNPEALTITDLFQAAGHATGMAGKWHLGSHGACLPQRRGFDSSYHILLSNNQTAKLWREDELAEDPFDNRLLTEKFATEAIRFIKAHRDRPFFLYLPFTAPHFPVEPHPEWKGRSQFGDYGDVVEELDHRIGDILATLADCGLLGDSIIVFLSDNGPQPREQASALPFRGEKWSALEGGTRVPCIVNWPGVIPAGQTSDALVSAMDLLPTLARAAGLDWRAASKGTPKIDGFDIWDTLTGKPDGHPRHELLYWHGLHPEPRAIRVGDWKLFFDRAHAFGDGDGDGGPALFNLRDDPGEASDLAARFPETVTELLTRGKELINQLQADKILPLVHSGPESP